MTAAYDAPKLRKMKLYFEVTMENGDVYRYDFHELEFSQPGQLFLEIEEDEPTKISAPLDRVSRPAVRYLNLALNRIRMVPQSDKGGEELQIRTNPEERL